MQGIYLCRVYIYAGYISMQGIYLCRVYIYAGYISMQGIYLCRVYIYAGYISMQGIYLCRVYIYAGYISMQGIYLCRVYIYAGHIRLCNYIESISMYFSCFSLLFFLPTVRKHVLKLHAGHKLIFFRVQTKCYCIDLIKRLLKIYSLTIFQGKLIRYNCPSPKK